MPENNDLVEVQNISSNLYPKTQHDARTPDVVDWGD